MSMTRPALPPAAAATLCLACAGSLPPRARAPPEALFRTRCCARAICPACLAAQPRLARYDPCLACLSGVGATRAGSGKRAQADGDVNVNVNAAVRDRDLFEIGADDDDEDGDGGEERDGAEGPPAYAEIDEPGAARAARPPPADPTAPPPTSAPFSTEPGAAPPRIHHLKPSDTLAGLSLRLGVPARTLCALNRLPPSTISTTPQLLHTRTFLVLPTGDSSAAPLPASVLFDAGEDADADDGAPEAAERRARRAHERAAKRLQLLTKEADWRVADAYVALAALDAAAGGDAAYALAVKAKEAGGGGGAAARTGVEGAAVDAYLDDEDWEARMRADGARPPASSSAKPRGTGRWLGI